MSLFEPSQSRPGRVGARIAITFLAVGVAWVLVTDVLLFTLTQRPPLVAVLETAKGWAFVALSAVFLYFVSARHIARLQTSESTLRATVTSIADGILLVGPDGRVADASPSALRMLGVSDKQSIIGCDAREFQRRFRLEYPDGKLVPVGSYISQRALLGEPVTAYKAVLHPENGGPPVTITASAAPVRIRPDGPVELAVSVMTDITTLDELDRMRDEFFAAAAHSLKTPVTIIKGHAQFLSSRATNHDERRVALALDRQCGRIDRLVQNLILLSRLQSGSMRLQPTEVELRTLAEMALRDMRNLSPQHTLREEWHARPVVFADPSRLGTALRNLIDRAYTTSKPNSEVKLLLEEADHRARFGVRYEPWERVTPESLRRTDRYAGLDVGTHVTAKLVEAHGGRVEVTTDGDATTTWVELPTVEVGNHGHP